MSIVVITRASSGFDALPTRALAHAGRTVSAGIRAWDRTDNIGKHARFELVDAVPDEGSDSYVVTLAVSGDGCNGTGPMRCELRDGVIAQLLIS